MMTMQQRRDYHKTANDLFSELGYRMCSECGWCHDNEMGCQQSIEQAHSEALLREEIESVFAMPEDPTTPTPDADRWHPSCDDKHMSKSAVRRMTGWSNDQIERILGEPDEIAIESDRHVKLYHKARASDAHQAHRHI